jgi:hypothetical protein
VFAPCLLKNALVGLTHDLQFRASHDHFHASMQRIAVVTAANPLSRAPQYEQKYCALVDLPQALQTRLIESDVAVLRG